VVQVRRLLWILLLAALVAPLGQAIEINQDFSPNSEALTASINNPVSYNSFSGHGGYISPTFSYQEGATMTPFKNNLDIMQISPGYDDYDFLETNGAFPLDQDSSASNSLLEDPAREINSNLLSLYGSKDSEDNNLIATKDNDAIRRSTARYYYEKSAANDLPSPLDSLTRKVNSDLDYIYRESSPTSAGDDKDKEISIDPNAGSRKRDEDSLKYLFVLSVIAVCFSMVFIAVRVYPVLILRVCAIAVLVVYAFFVKFVAELLQIIHNRIQVLGGFAFETVCDKHFVCRSHYFGHFGVLILFNGYCRVNSLKHFYEFVFAGRNSQVFGFSPELGA
jgi:hypothetical protein